MSPNLKSRVFSEHLHTSFYIQLEGSGPLTLKLVEVTVGKPSPGFEQFSLFFLGPHAPQLGQGTHKVKHDKMGSFDLFLVPVGVDRDGMLYEAAFAVLVRTEP